MVIPFERRVTKQTARKGASRMGFAPRVQRLCCPPCKGSPTFGAARAAPLRPVDAETRLMHIIETASIIPKTGIIPGAMNDSSQNTRRARGSAVNRDVIESR